MASNNKKKSTQTPGALARAREQEDPLWYPGYEEPPAEKLARLEDQAISLKDQVISLEHRVRTQKSTKNFDADMISNLERRLLDLENIALEEKPTRLRPQWVEDQRESYTFLQRLKRDHEQGTVPEYDRGEFYRANDLPETFSARRPKGRKGAAAPATTAGSSFGSHGNDITQGQKRPSPPSPDPLLPPPERAQSSTRQRQTKRQNSTKGKDKNKENHMSKEKGKEKPTKTPSRRNEQELSPHDDSDPDLKEEDENKPGRVEKGKDDEVDDDDDDDDVLFMEIARRPDAQ